MFVVSIVMLFLSRLNRCHPQKHDTFVLDFYNKPAMIEKAFSRYYRTTLLSGETDPTSCMILSQRWKIIRFILSLMLRNWLNYI